MTDAPPPSRVPGPMVVSAAMVLVEALALVVVGVAELVALSSAKLVMGVTTTVFFLVYGVGLGVCGWLLLRLRSWARAPVVLAQLIQLGVAWSFRGGGTGLVAGALAVAAVLVLAGVFAPASLRALAEPE